MATTIAKASIQLSANATEVVSELDRTTAKFKAFEGKIKSLPEIGEKVNASFGRIDAISNSFKSMSADASGFEKSIESATMAIGAMTVGMQVAMRMASGLKAALLGSGVGALIVGAGYLLSMISSSRAASSGSGGRGTDGPSEIERLTTTLRDAIAGGGGTSTTERTIEAAAAEMGRARTAWHAATFVRSDPRIAASSLARAAEGSPRLIEAAAARERSIGVDRVGGIESARSSARDALATMGMSAEEVDAYRMSLRRTTRTIGDLSVATTEAISPTEAFERRMAEIARLEALASGPTADSREFTMARVEARRALEAETAAMLELSRTTRLLSFARERAAMASRASDLTIEAAAADPTKAFRTRSAELTRLFSKGLIDARTRDLHLGRAATEALRGGMIDLPTGPAALMEGSAAAASAINAARRAGSDSPEERAARALEIIRRSTDASERHAAAMARVLTDGIRRL
jgi:hypothetical protein